MLSMGFLIWMPASDDAVSVHDAQGSFGLMGIIKMCIRSRILSHSNKTLLRALFS